MKYNELSVSATPDRKRVGRGIAGGGGKTAGRGTKGQGARTGKKLRVMFQGGQRPLAQAVPKARGFKSIRTPAQVVYLDNIGTLKAKTIDNQALFDAEMIASPNQPVKVILRGEFTAKINLHVSGASKNVIKAIEAAGGTFVSTAVPLKQTKKSD
jgi:large subunit ribosomal protein L15